MDKRITEILEIPAEDRITEFKRLGNENKLVSKTIETIVAMANTDGGRIILGVDDPEKSQLKNEKRIFGIEENLELFDEIGRNISRIHPSYPGIWPPEIIKYQTNKSIAVINIPKAKDNFLEIDNNVFVRLEKGNKSLKPHEIVKFSYAKGFTKADIELADVDFELLNTENYLKWREARKLPDIPIRDNLFKTGLARKDSDGKILPTNAAVLLFADFPSDIIHVNSEIRVLEFTDKIERFEYGTLNLKSTPNIFKGPIYKLIEDVHSFVLDLLKVRIKIQKSGFENEYALPERVVKEAITNAVIHRDYHINQYIEVKIFPDRLEVLNPGLFASNITIFNIGKSRADEYRNRLLVKHLLEFPSPPNLDQNEGVQSMFNEMKSRNLYQPVYFTYPDLEYSIKLVLYFQELDLKWEKVKKTFIKNKYISNEIARKAIKVENYQMSRLFKKWTQMGLLIKIEKSSDKSIKYKLKHD